MGSRSRISNRRNAGIYTRKSGYKVDYKLDTPEEIAKMLKAKWDLGLNGGMVVANQ